MFTKRLPVGVIPRGNATEAARQCRRSLDRVYRAGGCSHHLIENAHLAGMITEYWFSFNR